MFPIDQLTNKIG